MALFKISKGTAANLVANRPYAAEGNAYFTTDDGKFYIDIAGDGSTTTAVVGTNRIPLNAAQADKVANQLQIQFNSGTTPGQSLFTYDGSGALLVNITPQAIGAAPLSAIGTADHWATARDFVISDADGTNVGVATAVDGTSNVTLYLPSTIKASITGNASTATAVSSNLTIQFNSGSTEGSNLFTYNGSIPKTVNITPSAIGALALSGGTMTGSIVMPTGSSAVNTTGSILWEQSGDTTVQASIGSNSLGTMAIAAVKDIRLYPKLADTNIGLQITANSSFGPLTDNTWSLGSSSKKWANVYAYNFIGNASTASQLNNNLVIQFNNGSTEGNNLFTYNGSAGKTINITPSVVGAVAKSGDEMTGDLILSSSTGDSPSIIFKRGTELDTLDDIRLYDNGGKLTVAHRSGSADWVDLFTFDISANISTQHLLPSVNDTLALGASDHKWATVYATTFSGNATSADQLNHNLQIQLNSGTTEGTNLFTYNGSAVKQINITPASIGAVSTSGAAASADKWTTARAFTISDAEGANTGAAVNVDGSAAVTLLLPSTIKANLTGNASTATKLNNTLQIQLNSGSTEGSNLFTYDGSVQKLVNITPASISALALAGGTMTGDIKLYVANNNDTPSLIFQRGTETDTYDDIRLLDSGGKLVIQHRSGNATWNTVFDFNNDNNTSYYHLIPSSNNTLNLGSSTNKWSTVYATSFNGLATEASKVTNTLTIQLNSGSTEGSNLFTYDGSAAKTVNITAASIGAVSTSGAAASANKWTTAREFKISDADATNTSVGVNVDGSANVTLKLPATIKATLTGNATTADKVNHDLAIQFNSGSTEGTNLFTYNGSAAKTVNITPGNIGAVAKSGDTMTGLLTLSGNPTSAMHAATKQYVDNAFGVNDAMVYKGAIEGNATSPGAYTPAANAGWTYRITKAGYINGEPVEVGDMIICNTDSTAAATSSNYSTIKLNWNIVQVNVDKALYYGLNALSTGAVLLADGTSGKAKTAGTVGSSTQPIYLNGGVPTALTFTANRLYYSASTSSFTNTGHYASTTKIGINSTSEPTGVLHINGKTTASDNIEITMSGGEPTVSVSNGTHKLGMLIASQGSRHGLWSFTSTAKYLIYRDGSGSVYIPDWASIGSTNQPVYIDANGRPTTTQFTIGSQIDAGVANRIAYYKGANEIDDASTHYISDTQINIGGTSAPATGFSLEVTSKAKFSGGLEVTGHIAGDASSTGHGMYSGGGYHRAYNNIFLHGDATTGTSGIAFVSDKGSTTINQPSDGAFIQYHAFGVTTPTAYNTDPTLATSGEAGRFVIGVSNDAADQLWLQTPSRTGLIHQVTTNSYVIPDTNNTTGTVGAADQPVYVDGGAIKSCTYYLKATVQAGTQYGVAYYSTTTALNSTARGAANTALMGKGAAAPAFVSVSPTLTPTSGTTAGQKIKLTVLGVAGTEITLDSANGTSKSGVVTTGDQSFGGIKTFVNATESSSKSTGAVKISGGLGVNMTMSALKVRIGDKVRLEYNSTTLSLDFIFE